MSSILVINAAGRETRVALVENGHIAEFYLERKKDKGIVGNIYKGRVVRVLPGMQAAFVDVGLEKAAFLYVTDVFYDADFSRSQFELTEGEHDDAPDVPEEVPEEIHEGTEEALAHDAGHAMEFEVHELPPGELSAPADGRRVSGEFPAVVPPGEGAGVAAIAGSAEAPSTGDSAEAKSAATRVSATGDSSDAKSAATGAGSWNAPSAGDSATGASAQAAGNLAETGAGSWGAPASIGSSTASAVGAGSTSTASGTTLTGLEGGATGSAEPWGKPSLHSVDAAGGGSSAASSWSPEEQARPESRVTGEFPAVGQRLATGEFPAVQPDAARATGEFPAAVPQGAAPAAAEGAAPERRPDAPPPGRTDPEVRGERRAPREERNREKHRRDRDRDRQRTRDREEDKGKAARKTARIEDLLKVGQEVLVQISKDPIGTKGARLTCHISIPGRHLVFMPTVDHVGISRRIANEKERRRLREIVDRLRPPGTGFIVRTVAENVPQEKLEADIRFLIEVWNETVRKNEKRGGPGLMHSDLDLILRATRDLFAQDVEKLVVDDRDEYERICNFVSAQDASLRDRVILHDTDEPIFDAYGIEDEIRRATQRKVWLKSGGYLIMDQAEALTAIDVNSGRYVGKKSLEETITKINVEAAKEIVYQLRLRNIGGIIICDFIDMEKQQNRDKVFKTLQEALGRDKAKTNVLRISELGLVEMTRKRVRESIGRVLHEDCAYCDGQGFVKTATTVCYEIFRAIRREGPAYKDPTLVANCHGDVARLLQGEERQELRHLMDRYNKSIQIKAQQNYHREQFDIYGRTASGSDHKVAGSTHVGSAEGFGAPKQRDSGSERSGGRERERSERDRGGRGRDRGRDRGRGDREGGGNREGRDGQREGGRRDESGREGQRDGGRDNHREGGRRDESGREGQRDGGRRDEPGREGQRDSGREGQRDGGREGQRDGGREGQRDGGRRDESAREGGREGRAMAVARVSAMAVARSA